LWDSPWGFAGSAEGRADGMSFKIGKVHLLLSCIGILSAVYMMKKKKWRHVPFIPVIAVVVFMFSVFMTLEKSVFIWNALPMLAWVQFPWRFLVFILVSISVLAGLVVTLNSHAKKTGFLVLAIISILVAVNSKYFVPQSYYLVSDEDFKNEYTIKWDKSKISDEYLSKDLIRPKDLFELPRTLIDVEDSTAEILYHASNQITAVVQADSASTVVINQAYFPGWTVLVDKKQANITSKNGLMAFSLPAGYHSVEALFTDTPLRKIANSITLVSLIVFFGTIVLLGKRTYEKNQR
jgi:hypothetical protein